MPGLARKVIICAAVDGLILHPLNSKKDQRPSPPVKIKYGDASISHAPRDALPDVSKPNSSFEAFGIVGLITVSRFSYLITVTRRQQVAQIRGAPIYVVTEVALTPCTSYQDASAAIADTATVLRRQQQKQQQSTTDAAATDHESSYEDDTSGGDIGDPDPRSDDEASGWSTVPSPNTSARSSIAEDVISRRGSYGRFAQRWFSRTGWAIDQKRNLGLTPSAGGALTATTTSEQQQSQLTLADAVRPTEGSGNEDGNETENEKNDFSGSFMAAAKVVAEQDPGIPTAGGLLPKLLRTTQILFGSSRSFFFAYDYDITRSALNPRVPATALAPLYNHVDPLFFWNKNIMQPFIDAGADAVVLPLMQGFVGQKSFIVDGHPPQVDDAGVKDSMEMSDFASGPNPSSPPNEGVSLRELRPSQKQFDITIISRRSVKRAGLRYHRRGVDEDGFVANSVETEQVLSPSVWDPAAKILSFVQVRGSIPLFFTQSPYSLKPAPVMQHSAEANFLSLKKHFDSLSRRYGELQIVNLVEKHGTEGFIGDAYEKNVARLNKETREARPHDNSKAGGGDQESKTEEEAVDKIPFEWFDFHLACRGMKFENVSLLLQILGKKLETFGSTTIVDDCVTTRQTGALRTNCMDCLDRTNVCQSSFAKHMLDQQLKEQGFDMSAQLDQEMAWFNTLWADNGDAISKQYASTAAMKGDYTRTKKRNYRGALTDAGLSLTRFFNGMVNDFFLQATLDFLLGNVTSLVFEEFEATMMTKDPAVSMQKMREQAIELCQKRVVADESEEFIGGWAMLTPRAANSVKAQTFEEAVLLLTDAALYLCRFDWNLDKVSSFERAELSHVQTIRFGTYITSTISPAQVDEMRNVGLVVEYKPGSNDVTRINTRSLSTSVSGNLLRSGATGKGSDLHDGNGMKDAGLVGGLLGRRPAQQNPPPRKIALKALYTTTSYADPALKNAGGAGTGERVNRPTEIQQVVTIAAEIERLAVLAQPRRFEGKKQEEKALVEKSDIISLAEAKRSTGLLEQLGHSIKKMVWA